MKNNILARFVKVAFKVFMGESCHLGARGASMGKAALLSSMALAMSIFLSLGTASAHEIVPAIADLEQEGDTLKLDIRLSLEGILAGIDLANTADTNDAPEAERYDALRALSPEELAAEARLFWPQMAEAITLKADGKRLEPVLEGVDVTPAPDLAVARDTTLHIRANLPEGAEAVTFRWAREYGAIVIRQQGVEAPYTGFLQPGEPSAPIFLAGGNAESGWEAFVSYIPVGFRHILPLGIDHILFVLGLFFLSTHLRPLIWQVSAFTVAHTISLALAASGRVDVPASIVEPLIAASITFVAIENVFSRGLNPWRPFVVFGFGLLHGLGFASVLEQFGLPQDAFIPALIGFNVGVELGQLTVIAIAFFSLTFWFGKKPWYRQVIAIPISVAIAIIGAWWVVERTLLA